VPIAIGETFERYEIESLIGRGGMGEVYRAVDTRLRRKVALKVLRPDRDGGDAVARLFREARAAAVLAHPNTVAIHDIGESEGIFYIVMELVTGTSLLAHVGDARVPAARKLAWLVDIARALSAAHKSGVIHRDVKPSNVMVSDEGVVKVLDFGLARPLAPVSFRTQEGHVLGTPRYMSPEQLAGAEIDARSDQYAFALTAYELVTGKHPGGVLAGSVDPPPLDQVLPEISRAVAQVVARAMAQSPSDRFESMEDVAIALDDAINGRAQRGAALARPPDAGEVTAIEMTSSDPAIAAALREAVTSASLSMTVAVTTKRAGGDGAKVVAKMDPILATMIGTGSLEAAATVPAERQSESDVPTATARTTALVMASVAGNAMANVMAEPDGLTGPNGTLMDPKGMARNAAQRPVARTLMSREAPTPLMQPAATPAAVETSTEAAEAIANAFAKAKAKAEARAQADAKAEARAQADAKAKADAASARARADAARTTGADADRTPAGVPKPGKIPVVAVLIVVLGACAFAGAYYGSRELRRPPVVVPLPEPAVPAAEAAPRSPLLPSPPPTATLSIVPLSSTPAESASAAHVPPRPAATARPKAAVPTSSPLDMKVH
jgi:serine/threonine-protein kinase